MNALGDVYTLALGTYLDMPPEGRKEELQSPYWAAFA